MMAEGSLVEKSFAFGHENDHRYNHLHNSTRLYSSLVIRNWVAISEGGINKTGDIDLMCDQPVERHAM